MTNPESSMRFLTELRFEHGSLHFVQCAVHCKTCFSKWISHCMWDGGENLSGVLKPRSMIVSGIGLLQLPTRF